MKRLLLLLFIQALGHQVLAVGKTRMETTGSASFLDADYTITTTGGELVVTDLRGTGEVLEISENSGNIRFTVSGTVNLTGVSLVLNGNHTPTVGQLFTIVRNDGTDAITGTFQGLAEGTKISNFLVSQLDGTISYTGGDGNDVVVSVTNPLPVTLVSFTEKKQLIIKIF